MSSLCATTSSCPCLSLLVSCHSRMQRMNPFVAMQAIWKHFFGVNLHTLFASDVQIWKGHCLYLMRTLFRAFKRPLFVNYFKTSLNSCAGVHIYFPSTSENGSILFLQLLLSGCIGSILFLLPARTFLHTLLPFFHHCHPAN